MIPRAAALAAVATLPDGLSKHRRRLAKLINEIPEEETMTQSTKDHPAILEERAAYEATIARLTAELEAAKKLADDWRIECLEQNSALLDANDRAEAAEALLPRAYEAGRDDAAGGLDRDVADREADANRFRGGSNPHHYRMNLAQAVKYHAEQIRALTPPADLAARLGGQSEYENKVAQMKKDFPNGV